MNVILEPIQSRRYEAAIDNITRTFIIIDKETNKTSLRFVCYEGFEEYKHLKRLWRTNRKAFDIACANHINEEKD